MKKKLAACLLSGIMLVFVTAGCAGQTKPAAAPAPAVPKPVTQMVISTGGTSGSYFPVGGAIAGIITKYGGSLNVTAQTSGGNVENLKLLESGDSELALAQSDLADYAMNGVEMFDQKLEKIRAIAALYPEYIQVVARGELGIQSIAGLKGKTVSVGAPGSGLEATARRFLSALDIPYESFKPQFVSYTDAVKQFRDKRIDVMIIISDLPSPAIMHLAVMQDVTVVGFSAEEIAKLNQVMPFMAAAIIPAGIYEKQEADVQTIAAQAGLFTSADIPEDAVYSITQSLWENLDELTVSTARAKSMLPGQPVRAVTVPVHPGAARYYQEKGIKIN